MIYAVPITETEGKMQLCLQFARSPFFAIVDRQKNNFKTISNPFAEDKKGVGKKIIHLLKNNYNTNTLVGFELGLKVLEMSKELKLNVIIINEKFLTLNDLFKKMTINPNKI